MSILLAKNAGSKSFELISQSLRGFSGIGLDEQVNVVRLDFQGFDFYVQFFGLLVKQVLKVFGNFANQYRAAVLRAPDQVIFQGENTPGIYAIPLVIHAVSLSRVLDFCQVFIIERRMRLPLSPKGDSPRR